MKRSPRFLDSTRVPCPTERAMWEGKCFYHLDPGFTFHIEILTCMKVWF